MIATRNPALVRRIPTIRLTLLALATLLARPASAAVPPAERLLPPETLFVISAPDWTRLQEIYRKAPQNQIWDDPALKPFREKFMLKWNAEIVTPLERDLGVKFEDYTALLQGQLTLAVLQEGWQGKAENDGVPGAVLLLDAREKSDLLKKNLAALRQKWTAAGKPIKTEKIRDVEFSVVTLTTNDIPATIRKLLPQPQEIQELGDEKKETAPVQLVVGQYESLLILSSTTKAAEKIMMRYAGGGAPTLADAAEFANCQRALFRDAPLFGWLNTKLILDVGLKILATQQQNPDAPSPIPLPDFAKIVAATGLTGVKSVGVEYRDTGDGALVSGFISAPESARAGFLKLLAVDAKDAAPPAFVPADVLKYSRVRLDGPKAIATLEKMIGEISPQGTTTFNFLINNANEAARLDDPDYDLRKDVFANLGDDIISFEKAPRGKSLTELSSAPTLVLVASPNADKLAASLKGLLVIAQSGAPKTREFLGRKIYSMKLGRGGESTPGLSYVASGGYVAFSTDEAMIEDYLRSADSQVKPLREIGGFAAAADKVGGTATGWLGYENQAETMRLVFAMFTQKSSDAEQPDFMQVLANALPFAPPEEKIKEWVDFSLLPSYDALAKYYGFVVTAGQASVNGMTFRLFAPIPAGLLKKSGGS